MPRRACLECGEPTDGSYCARHDPRRQPGATTARGLGADHQRRRRELLPAAIGTACPLCGQTMRAGEQLDLDHSLQRRDHPGSVGDRIVHASCNRGRR